MLDKILIIACGALAREIGWLKTANSWNQLSIKCIDAELHNRPKEIPNRVETLLEQYHDQYTHVFVAYADCGTGGQLDSLLDRWQVERLPGAHCYEFFATSRVFKTLSNSEPGTFYLTDFLVRHFDRLVIKGLKLDTHPQIKKMLFARYKRLTYLAQTDNPELIAKARQAAVQLDLEFKQVITGFGDLEAGLKTQILRFERQEQIKYEAY